MGRLDHSGHFQAELAQQIVVGGMHRGHAKLGVRRLGQFCQGVGAHLSQAFAVGAGVLGIGFGVVRVKLAQFPGDVVDLGNGSADRQERVWVHHLARAACGNTRGGQQRYVFVGFDDFDVRGFAGGDHAVGEVVMTDAVEHDHVQPADALDVFGAGLVGMRVETGRNQRHHFGLVADEAKRLRIGITLHPYFSYVANIVGDKAEVVPLIPAGFNPHAYEPRAEDIKRISGLDVVVLNGVGHDDFADRMIAASETPNVTVIEANENVPLLAATGTAARGAGKVVNPHTFLSISASIAQVNNIARELGKLDPDNAKTYTQNARAYGKRLRQMRADALAKLTQAPNAELRVATVHAAYDYLLREFGLEVTAVVEPAHGIEPSPSQLKKTIDQLRELDVKVIFSEMDFPSTYVETIQRESGVKLYPLSHISYGEYTADKYEKEMTGNLNTVVRAIQESGA